MEAALTAESPLRVESREELVYWVKSHFGNPLRRVSDRADAGAPGKPQHEPALAVPGEASPLRSMSAACRPAAAAARK